LGLWLYGRLEVSDKFVNKSFKAGENTYKEEDTYGKWKVKQVEKIVLQ
jgi:hypothetical protein